MNQHRLAAIPALFAVAMALSACGMSPMTSTKTDAPPPPAMAAKPMAAATMSASLSGAAEVPPVAGSGSGTVEASFDAKTNMLNWTVTYTGLSGPATAAHFHGPAMPGANAGVVVPITGALASPIKGSAVLTAAQAADLMAGKWYVNVHTAANPGGEVRGQVTAAR
jgi:CHRD domain